MEKRAIIAVGLMAGVARWCTNVLFVKPEPPRRTPPLDRRRSHPPCPGLDSGRQPRSRAPERLATGAPPAQEGSAAARRGRVVPWKHRCKGVGR